MGGLIDGCIEWMGGWVDEWMGRSMSELVGGWMDVGGWVDGGSLDGFMDER